MITPPVWGVSRFFYPFLTQGEQNFSHLPALEGN
jgi:hypothetical protein